MRTMMRVTIPVDAGNKAIRENSLPKLMQAFLEQFKPEAAYFFSSEGKRSALFVFDLKESSQIPSIVEPLFMGLNAAVELVPVMNADDLRSGLERVPKGL
jgi:hypothetical protein